MGWCRNIPITEDILPEVFRLLFGQVNAIEYQIELSGLQWMIAKMVLQQSSENVVPESDRIRRSIAAWL